jgi:hypothetical protein
MNAYSYLGNSGFLPLASTSFCHAKAHRRAVVAENPG